jgi:dimethylargininase
MVNGITEAGLGIPDPDKALQQHEAYIQMLRMCDLAVEVLDEDESFPDSVFVEDTAICTAEMAVITNPGAPSRKGEEKDIKESLGRYYSSIEEIKHPATVEGGDVMMAGDHFYIGISERTNEHGAQQLIQILRKYGYNGSTLQLNNILHLKSGISYLENNIILGIRELIHLSDFAEFTKIEVPENEAYASNSLWINDVVIVPEGFPVTLQRIRDKGFRTLLLDVSEFRKLDGGLSCLSLRLPVE